MDALGDAIRELEQARDALDRPDDRTKVDSIAASLDEMIDTEAEELTDAEGALGDTEFEGAAASSDNLAELEDELAALAEETSGDARDHLESARERVAAYRLRE